MIVLDASAALSALLNAGPARASLASEQLHAPHLVDSEVAGGLRRHVASSRITAEAGWVALDAWRRLGLTRYATPSTSLPRDHLRSLRQCAPGSLSIGAGQAMVDVDPLGLDTETGQGVALSSQVLLIGGTTGVPDKQRTHGAPPGDWPGRAIECRRLGHRAVPDSASRRPRTGPQGEASAMPRTSGSYPVV